MLMLLDQPANEIVEYYIEWARNWVEHAKALNDLEQVQKVLLQNAQDNLDLAEHYLKLWENENKIIF